MSAFKYGIATAFSTNVVYAVKPTFYKIFLFRVFVYYFITVLSAMFLYFGF